jgi:alpha-beta hydrolase superfamily lysophospholipase
MVAAALSASNGKPPAIAVVAKLLARIERARVGKRNPSPVLQLLTFGEYNKAFAPSRTEFDWLSRDAEEVDKYVADPLLGFAASTQTWLDMVTALSRIANPSNVAKVPKGLPLYLFAGDQDQVGDSGKGMKSLYNAYKRAAIFDVRLKLYPGGRHEMFNETNRQEVTDDFIAWCDEIVVAHA